MKTFSQSAAPMGPPPPTPSDRLLKTDIAQVGSLRKDIPLYRFRYIDGAETYVGVMAQDVLPVMPEAISTNEQGFMLVDYAKLGTRMVPWAEWQAIHGDAPSEIAVKIIHGSAPMGPPPPPPESDRQLKTDIVRVGTLKVFGKP
jgi:hypothetical protein